MKVVLFIRSTLSLLILAAASNAQAGYLPGYSTLFTLERTTNANQVVYEANLSNASNPIHPYWIMNAQDGHKEELTSMERNKAYGVQVLSHTANELKFVLVSFRSHPITVKINPDTKQPYAMMNLSAPDKIINNIFLRLSGFIVPKVTQVDVFYRDTLDGPILKESFDPNR